MNSLTKFSTAAVAALGFGVAGFVTADDHDKGDSDKDIVEVAKEAGQFEKLTKALEEAELVETLQGDGPFTVFAPNDDAFDRLPTGTLDALLEEANREQLRSILLYHVAEGKVKSDDIRDQQEVETVGGQALRVMKQDDQVMVNGTTRVIKADVEASNGVIHVIDGVLIPGQAAGQQRGGMEGGMGGQDDGMGGM